MKKNKIILVVASFLVLVVAGCKKDNHETPAENTLNIQADIWYAEVNGIYEVGVPLNEENYIYLDLNAIEAGSYTITTSEINGYHFTASGEFPAPGEYEIKLQGVGTPQTEQLDSIHIITSEDHYRRGIQVVSNLSNKRLIVSTGNWDTGAKKIIGINGRNELLWEKPGYGNSASVKDDILYIIIDNSLYAINIVSGAEIWTNASLSNLLYVTISENALFITASNGNLYQINPSTGEVVWEFIPESATTPSAPTVSNGTIYYMAGELYAVNSVGTLNWHTNIGSWSDGNPAISNDKVYIKKSADFYTINAVTGEIISVKTLSNKDASAAISNGKVYINGFDIVYCYDETSGNLVWETQVDHLTGSPFVYENKVLISSSMIPSVVALDVNNGEKLWGISGMFDTDILAHKGMIYCGDYNSVDGIYHESGKLISIFGGDYSDYRLEYFSIPVIYDIDDKSAVCPTSSGNN